ncbi:hypothetical protein Taro_023287 [Colocasia esculenta]|uniref:Saposin B-type domain-containing protein n=1 Tax=Colocasia esculenta TaxID=4460 RepID=A0A843V7W8_COLES|nr:hypothetical protein [Colocasia esculenta]
MKTGAVALFGFLLLLEVVFGHSAMDLVMPSAAAEGTDPTMDKALVLHQLEELLKNRKPSSEGLPSARLCDSCLDISRKARTIFHDPTSLGELAGTFCHRVPASLQGKCTRMVEMFKHQAVMLLQEAPSEVKFCKSAGFCPEDAQESSLPTQNDADLLKSMEDLKEILGTMQNGNPVTDQMIPLEYLNWNKTCIACHDVLNKVRSELEDPDQEMKLIASLLKACETEVFVYRCKKLVFAYGPLVISTLQKIVSADLCRMVHICVDPKNQTDPTNTQFSGQHLPREIAKVKFASCMDGLHKEFKIQPIVIWKCGSGGGGRAEEAFFPSMRTGVVPFLAFLICLVVFADCARDFFVHINGESPDGAEGHLPFADNALFIQELEKLSRNEVSPYQGSSIDYCRPCLEISKKAQSFLNDPTLASQIEDLAGSFCHLVPSDFEPQCKEMVGEFKKRAITFLQGEVLEEKFCNITGFCPGKAQESSLLSTGKAELHSAMEHLNQVLTKLEKVLIPEEAATAFHNNRDFLVNKLPLELKIITSLIKACETEVFATQCKKLVFAYGPMVISNVQRVVSLDLCHMVHICDEPKNQTTLFHGKLW